jgi:hypothetical protein
MEQLPLFPIKLERMFPSVDNLRSCLLRNSEHVHPSFLDREDLLVVCGRLADQFSTHYSVLGPYDRDVKFKDGTLSEGYVRIEFIRK